MQLWKISIIDENQKDISFAKLTTLTLDIKSENNSSK